MIVDNGKYYLYRHIRLDKNEPFYIGIGTKNLKKTGELSHYLRSNSVDRNKIWKAIVKKTNYKVEIVLETDNYDFIKEKEIEFISLYGRIDLKIGTLANLTDGGEGSTNIIVSESTRKKLSEKTRYQIRPKLRKNYTVNNTITVQTRSLQKDKLSVKVKQLNLDGSLVKIWNSTAEPMVEGFDNSTIVKCCKKLPRYITHKGFKWEYVNEPIKYKFLCKTPDGILVKEYMNQNDIKKDFEGYKCPLVCIRNCIREGSRNHSFAGYVWEKERITK